MHRKNFIPQGVINVSYCIFVIALITLPSACTTSLVTSKLLDVALKPKNTSKDTAVAWKQGVIRLWGHGVTVC